MFLDQALQIRQLYKVNTLGFLTKQRAGDTMYNTVKTGRDDGLERQSNHRVDKFNRTGKCREDESNPTSDSTTDDRLGAAFFLVVLPVGIGPPAVRCSSC